MHICKMQSASNRRQVAMAKATRSSWQQVAGQQYTACGTLVHKCTVSNTYQLLHEALGLCVLTLTPCAVVNGCQQRASFHDCPQDKQIREVHILDTLLDSYVAQPLGELFQIGAPGVCFLVHQVIMGKMCADGSMHPCCSIATRVLV